MPQYPHYMDIVKKFDILYCEPRLEPAYDQVQIYLLLISEFYVRGSEVSATRKVDLKLACRPISRRNI